VAQQAPLFVDPGIEARDRWGDEQLTQWTQQQSTQANDRNATADQKPLEPLPGGARPEDRSTTASRDGDVISGEMWRHAADS
jgi:hypothetical protein